MTRSNGRRPESSLTVDDLIGTVANGDDLRISAETLEFQAGVAASHGNPQLAENLRRAAEMTRLSDERVLEIYEALRPGRSTGSELQTLSTELDAAGASRCAALVREAHDAYKTRGFVT